ncbi:MAG: hypothetical protein CFH34_00657 [Alphaproteobacteria bacterium MarineAlpha9_Bin4]|nr:hypothetical protein [Pelagibacterales bacterium]PPR26897.1 MAG: hypothetical protein CFH34_00657 [Alphaproteobacteria bacterium MarineAlpha9_Bin4]|tara:strand:- start:2132 stop:2413 length:282 start_codon:yes stop_codon:yes gene_type:complete
MVESSFIEILIKNFSDDKLYVKIYLLLLLFFFIIVVLNFLKDIVEFFFAKHSLKRKLVNKEEKLKNLRKKYLDGKINAREYKLNTARILNSLK